MNSSCENKAGLNEQLILHFPPKNQKKPNMDANKKWY